MGGSGLPDLLSLAATGALPQQGGQGNQSPTTFGPAPLQPPQPQPRFQTPVPKEMPQQNSFASTGARKRYDRQQAISGIAQFAKAGADFIQAKKNRTLQTSI